MKSFLNIIAFVVIFFSIACAERDPVNLKEECKAFVDNLAVMEASFKNMPDDYTIRSLTLDSRYKNVDPSFQIFSEAAKSEILKSSFVSNDFGLSINCERLEVSSEYEEETPTSKIKIIGASKNFLTIQGLFGEQNKLAAIGTLTYEHLSDYEFKRILSYKVSSKISHDGKIQMLTAESYSVEYVRISDKHPNTEIIGKSVIESLQQKYDLPVFLNSKMARKRKSRTIELTVSELKEIQETVLEQAIFN